MIKYSGILFLLGFLFSCQKENFDINNLNNNEITILGHGGMGMGNTYPMNTYESILKCLNLGSDGSEIDVQMTKDSVLVAYHSYDLSDRTNMAGVINDLYWIDIEGAYYNSAPYLNYSLITLDELFSNIENIQEYKFTFDCKLYSNNNNLNQFYGSYVNAITNIISKYNLHNNIYLESQNETFLKMLQQADENYKLFIYPSSFESGLEIALDLELYGITISTDNITEAQIEIAHDNNLLVAIWNTQSEKENEEGVRKNPDFIQTDEVKDLVDLLR